MNKKLLNVIRNYNPCRPCDNDKVVGMPRLPNAPANNPRMLSPKTPLQPIRKPLMK